MSEHPLQKFWEQQPDWFDQYIAPTPEGFGAEGKLCIDTWNAAIAAAVKAAVNAKDHGDAILQIRRLEYTKEDTCQDR